MIGSAHTAGITPVSARLSGIEASRGVAALLVVLFHVSRHLDHGPGAPLLRGVFQFGHAGVDFFFVISGFIILFVHFDDIGRPSRLAHFMERRITRLIPVYWVALALTAGLMLAGHQALPSLFDVIRDAALVPYNGDMFLYIAWTLRFEALFYILFAMVIVNRTAGMAAMGLWFLTSAAFPSKDTDILGLPTLFHDIFSLEFLLGMTGALLVRRWTIPRPHWIFTAGVLCFAIAAMIEDYGVEGGYGRMARFYYGVPSTLIVVGLAEIDRRFQPRMPALARIMGSASYSIYLFQFVFIGVAWQAMIGSGFDLVTPVIVQFVLLVFAALAGGVAMSVYVEYPLMALIRKRRAVGRSAAPAG